MTGSYLIGPLLVAASLLAGCGGGFDEQAAVQAPVTLNVAAFADPSGPTAGVLQVYDSKRNRLAQTKFSNNAETAVTTTTADLRLVLELPDASMAPGSTSSGNFLSAVAPAYQDGSYIALSPITTLIDAYLQAHDEVDEPAARAKVLAYLGLPQATDVNDFTFETATSQFDSYRFYRAVDAAGGMAVLTRAAVADIDAGRVRSFGKQPLLAGAASAETDLLDKLSGNLTSWAGGKVQGWLLQTTGVNDLLKSLGLFDEDTTAKQLAALTDAVNALADLVKALPAALTYTERLMDLEKLRATLNEWNIFLVTNTASTPATAADLAAWSAGVLGSPMLTNLHDLEVGSGAKANGLIALLSQERPKYYDGNAETPYTAPLFAQFKAHRQLQELALGYKIEATHARTAPNLAAAELLIDNHYIHIKQQRQAYPGGLAPLDGDGVLDRSTGLVWARKMVVVNGYRNVAAYLKGSPYRLPTLAELQSLVPTPEARAAVSVDASRLMPQFMNLFGFEPERYPDGSYKDFGDLQAKGSGKRPGYVFTNSSYVHLGGHVRVFDMYSGKDHLEYYNPAGDDYGVPLLLVRKLSKPSPLYAYIASGPDRRTAQMKALINFDGSAARDVTQDVIWRIEGATPDTVHISNGPKDSGKIEFRTDEKLTQPYTVTGEYTYFLADGTATSWSFKESVPVQETGARQYSSTAALLLAPAQQKVDAYPFNTTLTAYRTDTNGRVTSGNDYYFTWSSSDPSVRVDNNGRVTVASAPAARKEVRITVQVGSDHLGYAYLILMP